MVALLTVERGIGVAELMESSQGKLAVPALRLLKAENVRRLLPQKAGHEIDSQTDCMHVQGGKGETHARLRARLITLKGPPQAPSARSPQFFEWLEDGCSALAWPRSRQGAGQTLKDKQKGAPGRRLGAPRSETFTGRGPASLTQAERGGTPGRLRRSHAHKITRWRILSSGLPARTDDFRPPIGASMNIGTFCYPVEKTLVPENTARQAASAEDLVNYLCSIIFPA